MKELKKEYTYTKVDFLSARWLTFLLLIVMAAGCSDSENPVGPDFADGSNITIKGSISGPVDVSGKVPVENKTGNNLEISEPDSSKSVFGNEIRNQDTPTTDSNVMEESTLSGEVPFSDVTVLFYEASDYISNQSNATLLASTTTDFEGHYSVSEIDEGIDLVVVVDSNPRLTSAIKGAVEESNGNVNSATAIVSEYWAGEIANSRPFDQNDFEEMLQTAADLLEVMTAEELYNVLNELVPNQFGDGFPSILSSSTNLLVDQLLGRVIMACEDIEFSMLSARPGTFIMVQHLPEELGDDPFAWMHADDDSEELSPVYLGKISDEEWELFVPVHPNNYLGGGEVQLIFRSEDETKSCGGFSFVVESLTPASGTFRNMVNELEESAIHMAGLIGYSRDELLSQDINDLESYAAILKSVITVIDGPDHTGSLKATLNGDISEDLLDLYDAMLSENLASEHFEKQGTSTQSATPFLPEAFECNVPLNGLSGGFATPEDLDCWMNVNSIFEDFNQNEFQTYHDFQSRAYTLMAAIPDPRVQEVVDMGETYLQFMKMMLASFEFLFPGEILGIELEAEPRKYSEEDDDTEGVWEASVVAHAKDWEFDMLLSLAVLPIGAGKGGVMLSKFKKQSKTVETLIEQSLDNVQGELQKTGIGVYTFEAQVFGPIDVVPQRDADYFDWELSTKTKETNLDPFSFTSDQQGFIPEAVGVTDLRVETKGGSVFKGQKVFNIAELEVVPMSVEIGQWISDNVFTDNESPYFIDLGQEIAFVAKITNALNKNVEWTVSPDNGGVSLLQLPGRDYVAEVLATEPGRYTVDVESVADTGPRADNNPRRFDRVTIWVGGLNVSNPGCVNPNESYQLTARIGDEPIDFSELEWDIDGSGSIDSDGLYTAGGTGPVTITFSLRTNPEQTVTITFQVRDVCGSFQLSSSEFNFEGSCVTFYEDGIGGAGGVQFGSRISDDRHGSISFLIDFREFRENSGDEWSVENPGWSWASIVTPNLPSMVTPSWHFHSDNPGFRELIVTQQMRGDEAVLSGSFRAIHVWLQQTEDGVEERETEVSGSFHGARDHRVDTCWSGS